MVEMRVNQLLAEMQSMAKEVQSSNSNIPNINTSTDKAGAADFSDLLKTSIEKVNEVQKNAGDMATRFEMGDKNVDLTEVMVNLQKANVSFQAMTQVRNRLVTAYQEIMNMQI